MFGRTITGFLSVGCSKEQRDAPDLFLIGERSDRRNLPEKGKFTIGQDQQPAVLCADFEVERFSDYGKMRYDKNENEDALDRKAMANKKR